MRDVTMRGNQADLWGRAEEGKRRKRKLFMMQFAFPRLFAFLLAVFIFLQIPEYAAPRFVPLPHILEAYAASSPISQIKIMVKSKLEVGQSLPDLGIEETEVEDRGVSIYTTGNQYVISDAKWKNSVKELLSGDEPQIVVTLTPMDIAEFYFLASYKAGKVSINGGSFVSARRDGDDLLVTLKVKMVTGRYDPPNDVYWNEKSIGTIRWTKPDNTSGLYEAILLRDEKPVYTAQVSALQYNFYPYMTRTGEYSVKVRTVTKDKRVGASSDYLQSGDLVIGEWDVSDGKGQDSRNAQASTPTQKVGWSREGNSWVYRYPTGELQQPGFANIESQWYYFDNAGRAVTGWQFLYNKWFFFYDTGVMALGWVHLDNKWYYLIPVTELKSGEMEGQMMAGGWRVIGEYYYYFNGDGSIYTGWLQSQGKWYYLNEIQNSLEGVMFTGWLRRDQNTYFLDYNGAMVEGWYQIDGIWHYFYPGSGEMARNTVIDGLAIDGDGIWWTS